MNKIIVTQSEQTSASLYVFVAAMTLLACFGIVGHAYASIVTQLDMGSQNSDVTELQTYLAQNSALYPSGLVTGYFGSLTQDGVRKFQVSQVIVSSGSPSTTGYGRVGPTTMASLNALMAGGTGIGGTVGDMSAPIMYPATVSVGKNEVVISWVTSESAIGRVMYSTSWPFLYASAASVSSTGYGATSKIVLTNLKSNTVYYYTRESIDKAGNVMWTTHESFKTSN